MKGISDLSLALIIIALLVGTLIVLYTVIIPFITTIEIEGVIERPSEKISEDDVLLGELNYTSVFYGRLHGDIEAYRIYATLGYTVNGSFLYEENETYFRRPTRIFDQEMKPIKAAFLYNGTITGGVPFTTLGRFTNTQFIMLDSYTLNDLHTPHNLTLCWGDDKSLGDDWTANSPNVSCKTKAFEPPKFEAGIEPNPLVITINSSTGLTCAKKEVNVTNKNLYRTALDFALENFNLSISPVGKRQPIVYYPTLPDNRLPWRILNPSDSRKVNFTACAYPGNEDFQTTAYVIISAWPRNSSLKVPFTIKVHVVE